MKQPQITTAKKYFETRVHNLPIGKCFITEDWKDNGLAQIVVMRNHTNGNVSFACFIVDLFCMGVRDAVYDFNVPESSVQERVLIAENGLKFVECDYTLAHNILYGGLAYAEDLQITPYKDWKIASRILEEDTDEVELIDIEFGKDGKPFLSTADPDIFSKYYNHLLNTLGQGNFDFLGPMDFKSKTSEIEDEMLDLLPYWEWEETTTNITDKKIIAKIDPDMDKLTSLLVNDNPEYNKYIDLYHCRGTINDTFTTEIRLLNKVNESDLELNFESETYSKDNKNIYFSESDQLIFNQPDELKALDEMKLLKTQDISEVPTKRFFAILAKNGITADDRLYKYTNNFLASNTLSEQVIDGHELTLSQKIRNLIIREPGELDLTKIAEIKDFAPETETFSVFEIHQFALFYLHNFDPNIMDQLLIAENHFNLIHDCYDEAHLLKIRKKLALSKLVMILSNDSSEN